METSDVDCLYCLNLITVTSSVLHPEGHPRTMSPDKTCALQKFLGSSCPWPTLCFLSPGSSLEWISFSSSFTKEEEIEIIKRKRLAVLGIPYPTDSSSYFDSPLHVSLNTAFVLDPPQSPSLHLREKAVPDRVRICTEQ